MSAPVLTAKLYVPPRRPGLILRPRLIEQLNEGLHRKLVLVSAPAGFGKTTLVGEWLAECGLPAAWLSLDEEDGNPTRFLTYLAAALRTVAPGTGGWLEEALQSPQTTSIQTILTALLNEISTIPDDFVLVLDDYHVVDSGAVNEALTFLLQHLPPRMHLVISTREDPSLPLARLRARGQLTELRADALRFTPSEAAEFLNRVMGLGLSAADVAALEARTEGWIAGLQLAALSMRGRGDTSGFVRAFAGDNRYIVDYLVEEVLQRQPEHVRRFLLQTSVLDRLSSPLCDAVTNGKRSGATLGALEKGNLFVVPLDDRRQWYRYHHLFADVLFAHLTQEQPGQVSTLHRRASEWYEQNGSPADAIRHALAARDFERASDLVEVAALAMLGSSQEETLRNWLRALPEEVVLSRPVLCVYHAFTLLGPSGLEAAEARLQDAERRLDPSAGMVVADEDALASLPGTISVARAYIAGARGDTPGVVRHARRAIDQLPENEHLWRGAAAALLGIAYWTGGDLEAAHRSFSEGIAHQQMAGHVRFQVAGAHVLADIRIAQGRLREAERTYEQSLRLVEEQGNLVWGTADLHVGLSEICRERNDLEAATWHLRKSKELGDHVGLPETRHRWYVAMARIKEARGDLDDALGLLEEAEIRHVESPDPDVRPVSALEARVWVKQGRLAEALAWARERDLSVDDHLGYLHEFEHITLARMLLARYESERTEGSIRGAARLLGRLLTAAEQSGRTGSVIEILVLQALAYQAQGESPAALVPLERALTLAEPEGYVRVFVDEGVPMARLLSNAAARGIEADYASKLLAAFGAHKSADDPDPTQASAEPLSQRELEVLRLIARGLSNREIGERLFLALDTVKGHNRRIFAKLLVQRRTEAVARAQELGLL